MTIPRLAPAARRAQITEAARRTILDLGLASTSLRAIAQEAQVSIGTVTYHFRSVDEILQAVVTREAEVFYREVVQEVLDSGDPRRGLITLMEPLFRGDEANREHWRVWVDYWAAVGRRPEIAQAYAHQIRLWEDTCTAVIADGIRVGVFREVEPRETAVKLAAYSDGLGIQLAQEVASLDYARARLWMLEFAQDLLDVDLRGEGVSEQSD